MVGAIIAGLFGVLLRDTVGSIAYHAYEKGLKEYE